ncbi:hypothetical protein [Kitasatospora griseola]|uniref:hypothetical protein n=1 Tax=Kitasatospora griseola TaxID=2064 RepID=UPI000ACCA85C|nr:hypothetical protein [Kitasatospora griseola]
MEPTEAVTELAEREGYGELLAAHRMPLRSVLSPIGLFLLPVAILSTVLACTERFGPAARSAGAAVALGCVVLAALAVRRDRRTAHRMPVVFWYADGLVIARTDEPPAAHGLDGITPYEHTVTVRNGRSRGSSSTVTQIPVLELRGPGGAPVLTLNGRAQTARFAALLAARRAPAARALLAAGERLEFGPFAVTPEGLVLDGVPHPWSRVRALRITARRVLLELTDGPARPIAIRDVPHLRTLDALVREHAAALD